MGKWIAIPIAALAIVTACAPTTASTPIEQPSVGALPMAGGRGDPGRSAAPSPAPAPSSAPRAAPQPRANTPQVAFPYVPQVEWRPTQVNFDWGRDGAPVEFIIIHYTAISYERTLRAFNNPKSGVSAQYVIRGDGRITQLVGEADTAWHAGVYWYNQRSIGIELELDPGTNPEFTAQQYYAAAALTCQIAARQGIPLDRSHVIGHNEIPWPNDHSDPGPTWGWPHFMWLTSLCAPPTARTVRAAWVGQTAYPDLTVGQRGSVTVTLKNTGSTAWRKGAPQEARLGVRGNATDLAFLGDGWPTADRPAVQNEEIVPPGGTATFTFGVRATTPGTYSIPLRGVVDGGAWMDDLGIYTVVTVRPAPESQERR